MKGVGGVTFPQDQLENCGDWEKSEVMAWQNHNEQVLRLLGQGKTYTVQIASMNHNGVSDATKTEACDALLICRGAGDSGVECWTTNPGFESLGHRSVGVSRLTLALALEVGSPTRLRSRIHITKIHNTRPIQSNIVDRP